MLFLLARPTEEEVVRVWTIASDSENLNHVEKLPMDVADDCDRRLDVHHVALLHQQLLRLGAYCFDHRLSEQLLSIQAGDAFVEVNAGCKQMSTDNYRPNGSAHAYQEGQACLLGLLATVAAAVAKTIRMGPAVK